ncbi:MAG: hypothetical protein M0P09_00710 [Acholeplasmataceae bacterium]|nr:hypothetical protein [Acholeplasmataceae bacterium]
MSSKTEELHNGLIRQVRFDEGNYDNEEMTESNYLSHRNPLSFYLDHAVVEDDYVISEQFNKDYTVFFGHGDTAITTIFIPIITVMFLRHE